LSIVAAQFYFGTSVSPLPGHVPLTEQLGDRRLRPPTRYLPQPFPAV